MQRINVKMKPTYKIISYNGKTRKGKSYSVLKILKKFNRQILKELEEKT